MDNCVLKTTWQNFKPVVLACFLAGANNREHLRTAEALGLENRRNQASREPLIAVQGQETIAPIIAIVTDVLLRTMSRVFRVIAVQDDELGLKLE